MKKQITKTQFQTMIKDGSRIMIGGFLTCGTPELLIDWLVDSGVKNLTVIANDAGYPDKGVGKLLIHHQVKKLIVTHIGTNPIAGQLMHDGLIAIELIPQGTFVDQIRAQGGGLGGILTPTGLHTPAEHGKTIIEVKGKPYILAEPIAADFALINAFNADPLGSLTYSGSARNFNPIMATAGDYVIAQVENFVDQIDPEHIITPHVFIDAIVGGNDDGQ